jgi:hypothetical protein
MFKKQQKRVNRHFKTQVATCRIGEPPRLYLYSVVTATAICGAAAIAFIHFAMETPDVDLSAEVLRQLAQTHPVWTGLVALLLFVVEVAALDVMGWETASCMTWLRHRADSTVRQVASTRLAIQVLFTALMTLLFALFPATFPHPHGRPPYLGLAMLSIPILLATVQWCRAERANGFTQGHRGS